MENKGLCPKFEKAVHLLSKRWTSLIIYKLLSGPQRFCTIESSLPISGRLLSERLKELEAEGIVKREVYPETPIRVEYSLTNKGLDLKAIIVEIENWSGNWITIE
ncbi:MAG: winged helix-turn-helix transcriptional regulator [Bacillota bacterium]